MSRAPLVRRRCGRPLSTSSSHQPFLDSFVAKEYEKIGKGYFDRKGTPDATAAFAAAAVVGGPAYRIPAAAHALTGVAAPAAVIAGTVAATSTADLSPFREWTPALGVPATGRDDLGAVHERVGRDSSS